MFESNIGVSDTVSSVRSALKSLRGLVVVPLLKIGLVLCTDKCHVSYAIY